METDYKDRDAVIVIDNKTGNISFVAESRKVAIEMLQKRPDDLDNYRIETWVVWEKK